MTTQVLPDRQAMSAAAARHAADAITRVAKAQRVVRMVAATAQSQLDFQRALVALPGIDWSSVELFQLDEYIGLPADHPASFRYQLRTNLVDPAGIGTAHYIEGNDPATVRARMNGLIEGVTLDLAILGIGENGHLAFNDPPADFETTDGYLVVTLDEACRRQQVGEGWFPDLDHVPTTAVTMSIRRMLSAEEIIVVVPDARKAAAVNAALRGPVSPMVPASILRTHPNVTLYLDAASGAELR